MIAIVKYNAGNIGSVTNALNRLGIENKVTDDPAELQAADKVIFPGVGEAGTAMKYLRERGLDKVLVNLKQPVLGICLGMQLMCNHSEEGDTDCLGIFDTPVKKFPETAGMKVPHMGWNQLGLIRTNRHESMEQYLIALHNKKSPSGDLGVGRNDKPLHYSTDLKNHVKLKPFAQELRKNATQAERLLWNDLKSRKTGIQFKRQKPVGPFIPDFVNDDLKLIIELDGEIHKYQKKQDAQRQAVLASLGYTVLRFSNEDVYKLQDHVVYNIKREITKLRESQPLAPSNGRGTFSQIITDSVFKMRKSKLLRNLTDNSDVYYVHSYFAAICENTVAACDYILPFSSVLQKDNFYATQFHPEKSAGIGEQLLKNFVEL